MDKKLDVIYFIGLCIAQKLMSRSEFDAMQKQIEEYVKPADEPKKVGRPKKSEE